MTIIIGILCQDGIVVGADSSATFGTPQFRTIEQTARKIDVIEGKIILAGSGAIGLGQRFKVIVENHWRDQGFKNTSPTEVGKCLCAKGIQDFTSTNAPKGYGALLAYAAGEKYQLIEFASSDFQPEIKTENIWYVSIGSGQPIVDPFLGLMRRVFWGDRPPKLNEGIFCVMWSLQHAIEINTGGINGPPQVAVLSPVKGKYQARMLDDDEYAEHAENVNGAIEYLASYKEILKGKKGKAIPDIDDT